MLLNVLDFVSPAAALAAATDGDRVWFPGPGPYQAPQGGWRIRAGIEVFGDGVGKSATDVGTVLKPFSTSDHVFVIELAPGLSLPASIEQVHIHDFKIKADVQPVATGTGNGIHCITVTNQKATDITIERVIVVNVGNDAFHFEAADFGVSAIIFPRFLDCQAVTCGGAGFYIKNCVAPRFTGCYSNGNLKFGMYLETSGGACLLNCYFENNWRGTASSPDFDVQLRLKGAHHFSIVGCNFEEFDNNAVTKTAICVENTLAGVIEGCEFGNASGVSGSRGIYLNNIARATYIGSNSWNYVDKLIEVPSGCIGTTVMPQAIGNSDANSHGYIVLPTGPGNGNVGFLPTGYLTNVTAGLLLPNLATATITSIPTGAAPLGIAQAGLLVYDGNANKLKFYDGSGWRTVTSV